MAAAPRMLDRLPITWRDKTSKIVDSGRQQFKEVVTKSLTGKSTEEWAAEKRFSDHEALLSKVVEQQSSLSLSVISDTAKGTLNIPHGSAAWFDIVSSASPFGSVDENKNFRLPDVSKDQIKGVSTQTESNTSLIALKKGEVSIAWGPITSEMKWKAQQKNTLSANLLSSDDSQDREPVLRQYVQNRTLELEMGERKSSPVLQVYEEWVTDVANLEALLEQQKTSRYSSNVMLEIHTVVTRMIGRLDRYSNTKNNYHGKFASDRPASDLHALIVSDYNPKENQHRNKDTFLRSVQEKLLPLSHEVSQVMTEEIQRKMFDEVYTSQIQILAEQLRFDPETNKEDFEVVVKLITQMNEKLDEVDSLLAQKRVELGVPIPDDSEAEPYAAAVFERCLPYDLQQLRGDFIDRLRSLSKGTGDRDLNIFLIHSGIDATDVQSRDPAFRAIFDPSRRTLVVEELQQMMATFANIVDHRWEKKTDRAPNSWLFNAKRDQNADVFADLGEFFRTVYFFKVRVKNVINESIDHISQIAQEDSKKQ